MDKDGFEAVLRSTLLPMFAGARLAEAPCLTNRSLSLASYEPGACKIGLQPFPASSYRFYLERSQPFDRPEKDFIENFLQVLHEIEAVSQGNYFHDLLITSIRRAVARSIDESIESLIVEVIDRFSEWAEQTYEGGRIAAALGIEPTNPRSGVLISALYDQDSGKVLTNGVDTLLVCGLNGRIIRHEQLDRQTTVFPLYSPLRFAPLAEWAQNSRIAIALNRNGEILIFKNKRLVFAKRRGIWHHLIHDPTITQMRCPQSEIIRKAIYETCLDVSFARTGGCIAVAASDSISEVYNVAENPDDWPGRTDKPKSAFLRIVAQKPFQKLDRRLRQELVAMDGATIIDYKGYIRAAGAIVNVEGGSDAGGRLAAARALSVLGLGIKISQDGGILGFRRQSSGGHPKLAFSVCASTKPDLG